MFVPLDIINREVLKLEKTRKVQKELFSVVHYL